MLLYLFIKYNTLHVKIYDGFQEEKGILLNFLPLFTPLQPTFYELPSTLLYAFHPPQDSAYQAS